jgi:4-hydroxy-3-polyprenylbenzoate decarboxylase
MTDDHRRKSGNASTASRLVVAVTGASGALYAVRFLRRIAPLYDRIYVILSEHAPSVYAAEIGHALPTPFSVAEYLGDDTSPQLAPRKGEGSRYDNVEFLDRKDYFTPPASGSFRHDGMVIIPCSMGTLGRIANGISSDLVTRAADVCLKEHRKLILVARETPLSLVHLRNMTLATEAGAIVLPASPAFYHKPQTIEDLVDSVIARVMQNLGIAQSVMPEWQAEES